jgi:DNA-binding MarR family transcriptional regulator
MDGSGAQRRELVDTITGPLARRHSTATVLLHHAVAERLGLGPSDHKCLDLLVERGPMSGSQLASITGLTTGAITGVVNRLERSGFVRREADPDDGRKQRISPAPERLGPVRAVFEGRRRDAEALLDGFDERQLEAVALYLTRATEYCRHHTATLRAQALHAEGWPSDPPGPGADPREETHA